MNNQQKLKRAILDTQQELQVVKQLQQTTQGKIVQEGQYNVEKYQIFEEEEVIPSPKFQKQYDGSEKIDTRPQLNSDAMQNYFIIIPSINDLKSNLKNKQNIIYPENIERVSLDNFIHIKNDQKSLESPDKRNNYQQNIHYERLPLQTHVQTEIQIDPDKNSQNDENVQVSGQLKAYSVGHSNNQEINWPQDEISKQDPQVHPEIHKNDGNYIYLPGTNRESFYNIDCFNITHISQ